ncbi:MAG TPA: zinc ribbon domain-containing protein [Tepidisphaeraceae bacterium]|jgi:uncharacterized membrane protein YvbJ
MPKRPVETFTCPNCGADVRAGAAACPECGADDETGWSAETDYDGLDLPGDADDSIDTEDGVGTWRKIVAIVVVAAVILLIIAGVW